MERIIFLLLLLGANAQAQIVGPVGGISNAKAEAAYVNITGDTMTGPLTLSGSTLTVTGNSGIYGLITSSNVSLANELFTSNGNVKIKQASTPGNTTSLFVGDDAASNASASIMLSRYWADATDMRGVRICNINTAGHDTLSLQVAGDAGNRSMPSGTTGGLFVQDTGDSASSRVGINTFSPSSVLQIQGDVTVSSTLTVQGNAFSVGGGTLVVSGGDVSIGVSMMNVGNRSGYASVLIGDTLANTAYADSSALRIKNANDGTLQIRMGNLPTAFWDIGREGSATGRFAIRESIDGGSTILERFSILNGGNVGIGTIAPDSKVSISSSTASTSFISFLGAMTKAEILAFDPVQAGASAYCTNCAVASICISTGAAVSQFSDISNRTLACN